MRQNEETPAVKSPALPINEVSRIDNPFDDGGEADLVDWEKVRPDRKSSPAEVVWQAVCYLPKLIPLWLRFILVLLLGIGIGVQLVRQRRAAADVIMTIGKDRITGEEFFHRMEVASGPEILSKMEREKLMLQYAEQRRALPTEDQIQKRMSDIMLQPETTDSMATHHMTQEDIRLQSEIQLATEAMLAKGVPVSDQEIEAYYKKQSDPANPQSKFIVPGSIKIQIISALKEETIQKANQALLNGEDFGSVAEQYSMDRSAVNGGYGPILWRGHSQVSAIPGFEEAIFNLEKEERLGPKKFGNVWWIVRCDRKMLGRTLPFDRVKDICRSDLRLIKGQQAKTAQMEEDFVAFRKTVPVTLFWEQYYFDIQDQATRLSSKK